MIRRCLFLLLVLTTLAPFSEAAAAGDESKPAVPASPEDPAATEKEKAKSEADKLKKQADPKAPKGVPDIHDACRAPEQTPEDPVPDPAQRAIRAITAHASAIDQVKLAAPSQYMPQGKSTDVLLYRAFLEKDGAPKLSYRVVVADSKDVARIIAADKSQVDTATQLIPSTQVWTEAATQGQTGTDFRMKESSVAKTLISFTPDLDASPPWDRTRIYVIGCADVDGGTPKVFGTLEVRRSSIVWARSMAVILCALCYVLASIATFVVHRSRQMKNKTADVNHPTTGTNYAGRWRHLNPVVLSAGSNGRGSATKLQVLFFSLLVFGLAAYIWMLTGHLTGMSNTVLLLMGISGVGAAASAGTELTKNRLKFDNWAWLINRGWLPKGGVAEANLAQWKDIVTTDGEFDVYRFQMITFSLLVGLSLLSAGSQLMDLSSFDIPQTLLGILGLSQVVYVAGKLVAPPAIADLDSQIEKLRAAEKLLGDAVVKTKYGAVMGVTTPIGDDDAVKAARVAYADYMLCWKTTRTMFETTLGQLVPEGAEAQRPPSPVPEWISSTVTVLPDGTLNQPYQYALSASGGTPPYKWSLLTGQFPAGLDNSSKNDVLAGTPTSPGQWTFTLKVADATGASNVRDFTIKVI